MNCMQAIRLLQPPKSIPQAKVSQLLFTPPPPPPPPPSQHYLQNTRRKVHLVSQTRPSHHCNNPRHRLRPSPSASAPRCLNYYHSYDHPQTPPFTETETAILRAALSYVPTHGFTHHSLTLGAREAGYLDISTNLFPNPVMALINYHLTISRLSLASSTAAKDPSLSDNNNNIITERITSLILHRLHLNTPYLPTHLPTLLAHLTLPANLPFAVRELALLADEILFCAGSTTVSAPAWYLDRAGVGGIYAASELFMCQDRSVGFGDTEAFVRRRVAEVEGLRGMGGFVGEWVGGQVGGLVDGIRNLGGRI